MSYTVYYHGACKKFLGRAHGPLTILSEAGADFEPALADFGPTVGRLPADCGLTLGQLCAKVERSLARLWVDFWPISD